MPAELQCLSKKRTGLGVLSSKNDQRARTVEIASDAKDPYAITNGAMDGLIKPGADVAKKRNLKLLWKADKSLIEKSTNRT